MVCVAIEEIQAPFRCFRDLGLAYFPHSIPNCLLIIPEVPFPENPRRITCVLEITAYRREIEAGASKRISIV